MSAPKSRPAPAAARRPAVRPPVPPWLLAAGLALIVVAVYWPAMSCGFVNYDDNRYVTANPQVQKGLTLENLRWALLNPVADNWHPLTVLSHMLLCQICGLNPWGHHLANVLLHAANAALVFLLLRQLTGATGRSLMVAALFALHPLRVESVAWISERKDVLSGFFGLLALLAYTRYAQGKTTPSPAASPPAAKREKQRGGAAYWLAWLSLGLGLMSKPMLVTWPFVMLLLDYWPLRRISIFHPAPDAKTGGPRAVSLGRLVREKIPFFILAAAAGVVTFMVQRAEEIQAHQPFLTGCETALVAYGGYLEKFFWPVNLAVLYLHPGHWPAMQVALGAGFLMVFSALLVSQAPRHPYLLTGWLWYLGTLIPVIGLVQVGFQSMADRYTYLPSLGILILVVWGVDALTRPWRRRVAPLTLAGATILILCAGLTRTQLAYWRNGETLFRHALAVTQDNYIARCNLGIALDEQGRYGEAIGEYQTVVQSHPYARAYVNLGVDLEKTGRSDEAMGRYQQAIRLDPDNIFARNDLGVALYNHGRVDDAIQQFEAVLRLKSDSAEAHYNLGYILGARGQTAEAIRHVQEALRLKPDYPEVSRCLAQLQAQPGKQP